jgi:hypothetical protein
MDRRNYWLAASTLGVLLLFAVPLATGVYRIPVQMSEVLDIVQYVGDAPDVRAAFVIGLHAAPTMLRPLRQVHTRLLIDAAEMAGSYRPVFRGVHAALAVLLLAAFVAVARPRSALDLFALTCALAVLVGLHSFTALVREAYPVNHFLLVTLYAWVVLLIARSRGGVLADTGAALCLGLALLTLELGALVVVVACAAHYAGWKGISRRGLLAMLVIALAYAYLRVGYLQIETPAFAERATGFGFSALSREEQLARFGEHRWVLYAYTAASGAASVVLSQPRNGVWTLPAAWVSDTVQPWMIVHALSSLATSLLVLWYACSRLPGGHRGFRDPPVAIAGAVIIANALIGYAYAKDEILAFAGTFYALAVYVAARHLFVRLGLLERAPLRMLVASLACVVMMLWSVRVAGLHYLLREQAFHVRNDWALVLPPAVTPQPMKPEWLHAAMALKREALASAAITPRLLPPSVRAWLGEL